MKKAMLLFALLTLKVLLSSAQTTYPKTILIDKDTIIAYKPWQVKYVNDVYIVGFEECDAMKNHLQYIVDSAANIISLQGAVVFDLREQLRLTNNVVRDLRAADANSQKQISQLENKGKMSNFERNALAVGVICLIIKVFVK